VTTGAGAATVAPLSAVVAERPEKIESLLGRLVDAEKQSAFAAMNTAFFADGAFIGVPDGISVDTPIHVVHVATGGEEPTIVHPRTLISIGKGASATVVESYVGSGRYLTNAVGETFVDDDGKLETIVVERESASAYHFSSRQIVIGQGATSAERHFSFGASVVRGDFGLRTDGGESEGTLNGLYLADGDRHVDFHTTIDHAVPEAVTHELFKGVLGGKSSAAFRGRIIVREDSQKTDAYQTNRNLLLSRDAKANTRPQLEIYADDVKCSHGATVGEMDEEALFYFRSRGIGRIEAQALLTYAFAGELVEPITNEPIHDELAESIRRGMPTETK
jgi:Fe-S cluster assembly protein SufD